jgi:hypothetical protein
MPPQPPENRAVMMTTPGVKKFRYDVAPKPGISTIFLNSAANSRR